MESTEEDGVNSVVEQFYNELVKRQRDVLCCKSGMAGPTQPHCACMPSIAHPLARRCISPFQWKRESWRLGEPARERGTDRRGKGKGRDHFMILGITCGHMKKPQNQKSIVWKEQVGKYRTREMVIFPSRVATDVNPNLMAKERAVAAPWTEPSSLAWHSTCTDLRED